MPRSKDAAFEDEQIVYLVVDDLLATLVASDSWSHATNENALGDELTGDEKETEDLYASLAADLLETLFD
ncbi:hypothetical protein [Adhaeretor mobilis]|uniref:hypothetical protein n=1 Tax=Adhaeretor mobilis TaxID=1930276 RepID=UPI00119F14DF|nr:hypothetical protein [Adhaeretor mobilis]